MEKNSKEVLARYTMPYENENIEIELLQDLLVVPRLYFKVQLQKQELILYKLEFANRILWAGGERLEQYRELGEAIEEFTGFELAPRLRSNPFRYTGKEPATIESFRIDVLEIERAESPVSNAIFYRVYFKEMTVVIANCWLNDGFVWVLEEPMGLNKEAFLSVTNMLEGFEKGQSEKVYVAWKTEVRGQK